MSHGLIRAACLKMQRLFVFTVFTLLLAACMETPVPTDSPESKSSTLFTTQTVDGLYVVGYWPEEDDEDNEPILTLAVEDKDSTSSPSRTSQNLSITNDGDAGAVYLSWTNTDSSGAVDLKLVTNEKIGASYTWSDPADPMRRAFDSSTVSATMAKFKTNITADGGYALWETASGLNVREYMGSMHHFMGAPFALPEGHAPQFVNVGNSTVLITQTHMMGGFGLSAFERTAFNTYTTPAPQLHRMDSATPYAMAHDALITFADGENNVRAIWVETQGADTRLMTAVYDTDADSWDSAVTVLDAADIATHNIDISAIHSMSASGEHGNANIHLALFVDTADDEAIWTMDYDTTTMPTMPMWHDPVRRDLMGDMTMLSDVSHVVYHDHHLVAWIENHMGEMSIKTMRFTLDTVEPTNTGWGDVETIFLPTADVTLGNLDVALNHDGHAVAIWTETDATSKRIFTSLQVPSSPWALKEMVTELDTAAMLHIANVALYQDGTPIVAWSTAMEDAGTTTFKTQFSRRKTGIEFINGDAPAQDTGGDTGGTGGDTGGDTGGNTGGDTGGTGGDTGGTGGDTGGGTTGSGVVEAGKDYVSQYWDAAMTQQESSHYMPAVNPNVVRHSLSIVNNETTGVMDSVFWNWSEVTDSGEKLVMIRGTNGASGYQWTNPDPAMSQAPAGITDAATMTQFAAVNSYLGLALWEDAGQLKLSEYMEMTPGSMPHYMGTSVFGEGHAPRIVSNGANAHLVLQSHMMNGFGLDVYSRTGMTTWTTEAVQLHRMGDAANPMAMGHDDLVTLMDGNGNIRAIWIETQGTDTRLMTSVFTPDPDANDAATSASWSMPPDILLDTAGMTHGIDLTAITSFNASGEHDNANVHLAISVDSADDEVIYTMDFDGNTWTMPEPRHDASGAMTNISQVTYAVHHATHVVSWVEDHTMSGMTHTTIKSLRFNPTDGWGTAEDVAMPATMETSISELDIALNHDGAIVAAWMETDADGIRVLNAVQPAAGSAWAMKELVAAFAADAMISNVETAMHENGIPWVAWIEQTEPMAGMVAFNSVMSQRSYDVTDTLPKGTPPTDTGGTGGDTGGTGGDTGGTGGNTGGTGGDTGGTGGDTGGGTSDPNYTSTTYWGADGQLNMTHYDVGSNPGVASQKMQIVNNTATAVMDSVFLSWTEMSDAGSALKVKRGTNNGTSYDWTGALQPVGITAAANMTQFVAKDSMEGYALWDDAGMLKLSELMDMGVAHFMHTIEIGSELHAPRILVDGDNTYIVAQSHMMNGFGLNVYQRTTAASMTAPSVWSGPTQLHRMGDAANPRSMGHDDLVTLVDGMHNIRAVWKETQGADTRLMTAVFDTTAGTWGMASAILDTAGMTHGVDIAAISSFNASGEHSNANMHVAMFVDSASDDQIWTIDYDAGTDAWSHPMRRDLDPMNMTMLSGVTYAVNHATHVLSWIEEHMGMVHVKTLRFTAAGGWGMVETAGTPNMGATVTQLDIAVNHDGAAVAAWVETDADGIRISSAVQADAMTAWAMKELVADFATTAMISTVETAMHENGMSWIAWTAVGEMGGSPMTTNHLSMRTMDASMNTPIGGDTGGTGGDTGGTGGDTGGTGGDTGGTGGDTGGTGGDTGGTGGGTDPGTDPNVVDALWNAADIAASSDMASSSEAEVASLKLQATQSGNLYTSWLMLSDPDPASFEFTNTDPFMMFGTPDGSGGYTWSDPDSSMFKPATYNSAATDTQFFPNPYMAAMGIATWNYNASTMTSEFMNMGTDESIVAHFMGSALVDEGHATKVLYDSTGQAYLLTQTHMMHGFGLSVYTRGGSANNWSAAVELHRMGVDATNAYDMVNHFLISTVDGQDNIRAVWLEEHLGVHSLQTATFDTSTSTWGAVTEVDATGLTLQNLASGIASGRVGTADLQVVLHQQSGTMGMMNEVFAAGYTEAGGWVEPVRLDEPTATSSMVMAPAYAVNAAGDITVAWVDRDSAMAASNGSGQMNMVMSKHYMPGMGWHAVEHISHAWMAADVTALSVALSEGGEATATWMETYSTGSNIITSHKLGMAASWSQRELIQTILNADGVVTSLDVVIDSSNVAVSAWVQKTTDGINDTFQVMRAARSTAIDDAVPGDNTGGGTGGDTGGGTGGDTGGGAGTTDPGAGGNDIPVNTNWTTPVMASQMMHTTNSFRIYGPQVVMDDVGGTAIRIAMKNRTYSDGTSIKTVNNHVLHSMDNSSWNDILMGSGVMDELSSSAVVETIKAIPTLGNLYALIRDDDTLYLAQYDPDTGNWGKIVVEGVSGETSRRNMQLTTSTNGMVTIVWHEGDDDSLGININAIHLMDNAWGAVETLAVSDAVKVVTPHSVAANGSVQVAWLVFNTDGISYDLKMASYTPMMVGGDGWSAVMDGPTGLPGNVEAVASGENNVVIAVDQASDQIDAYVLHNSGSWTPLLDINGAQAGIDIINRRDVKVIAGGDNHFMAAWRERINVGESYTYRYRTAMIHYMDMGGTMMWHNEFPSEVGGSTSDYEQNLDFVLDNAGNAYAVWTGVDLSTNTENVYVNHAMMGDPWMMEPDLLASYDLSVGNYAGRISVAVNSDGRVGIAWDQHMTSGSMAMHHVWFVENQLP